VIFDYPARSFTLARPGSLKPRGVAIPSPISEGPCFPRIELEVGGKKYGFLLDTGASFTMVALGQLKTWAQEHPDWKVTEGAVGRANMMGGLGRGACHADASGRGEARIIRAEGRRRHRAPTRHVREVHELDDDRAHHRLPSAAMSGDSSASRSTTRTASPTSSARRVSRRTSSITSV
jgi:hypothetical protein